MPSNAEIQLQREMAQIAAGRRERPSADWQGLVDQEHRNELATKRQHERSLEESSKVSAAASKTAAEMSKAAAKSMQKSNALAEQALRAEQQYHDRIEALEAERNEEARETNEELLEISWLEREDNVRHRQLQADQEAQRTQLAGQAMHVEALRSSPCYAAALQLKELLNLERVASERAEIEARFLEFVPLAKEFEKALALSDAQNEALEKQTAKKLREQLKAASPPLTESNRQLTKMQSELASARRTGNPMTWFGAKSQTRATLPSDLARLQSDIESRQAQVRQLEAQVAQNDEQGLRAARVKTLMHEGGFTARRDAIAQGLLDWICSEPRSAELKSIWNEAPLVTDVPVDMVLCAQLDQALAAGASAVKYPGLGPLPTGPAFVQTMERIESLRSQGGLVGSLRGRTGRRELAWLDHAQRLGVFALDQDHDTIALDSMALVEDGPTEDKLYQQAVELVLKGGRVSQSAVQRHLKIGYKKAGSLIETMARNGVLCKAPDGSWQLKA